ETRADDPSTSISGRPLQGCQRIRHCERGRFVRYRDCLTVNSYGKAAREESAVGFSLCAVQRPAAIPIRVVPNKQNCERSYADCWFNADRVWADPDEVAFVDLIGRMGKCR